jgi:glutathione peroxidase
MKIFLTAMSILSFFTSCFNQSKTKSAPANVNPSTSFYDFSMHSLETGEVIDFSVFKGKKVVLVNVASKCGYTPQYADWEAFHKAHGDKIVVLGFPANNFMGQEPGTNEEIAEFCSKNYGVSFQMFEKISVKGDDQHPLYQWLSQKNKNGWNDQAPSWNFCKYVVDENGKLANFFASGVKPGDAEFRKAVGL